MNGTCPSIFLQSRIIVVPRYCCELFLPDSKYFRENFCIKKKHSTVKLMSPISEQLYIRIHLGPQPNG
jgi:hypothetical protein